MTARSDAPFSSLLVGFMGNANLSSWQLGSGDPRATALAMDSLCHGACALLL